ncbi:MAG: PorV/PorQ family protein [Ignavibacteriales bacterium]|nr:PorV/PorQ family protein [Ignavibacteriales bacterium]
MLNRLFVISFVIGFAIQFSHGQLIPNLGGQRAGISAFQFLKIGVGARAVGVGESFIAMANDVTALYWNPAGLTQFNENQITFSHTEYLVDLKHEFFGGVYHLTTSDAIGVSLTSLYTDPMEITTETLPKGTGRYFKFGDLAFGLSYARRMTDQFSFGITIKYIEETLDILKMRGTMVDLGTYYWTGLGSSRFAIVITNFGGDVAPSGSVTTFDGSKVNSFQSFSPPTQFKIGFAMEPYETETHKITTSIELNHPNDNAENVHLGAEYKWEDWLFVRAGFKRTIGETLLGRDNAASNDISFGVGVLVPVLTSKVGFDYSFSNYNLLGTVHRISVNLAY